MAGKSVLSYLDLCVNSPEDIKSLRPVIERIDRCCEAVKGNMNLADILNDPKNMQSITSILNRNELVAGMLIILNTAMHDYEKFSFNTELGIQGEKKFEAFYRARLIFEKFDSVICIQVPEQYGYSIRLVNPQIRRHWTQLEIIPEGSIVTLYVKTSYGERDKKQEQSAGKVLKVLFETMQHAPSEEELENHNNVIDMKSYKKTRCVKNGNSSQTPIFKKIINGNCIRPDEVPVSSLKVTVNKIDTVVHAGNAHLIIECLKGFDGRVLMFVLRGAKEKVLLNVDSIWAKEIRNGETVLFEFYDVCPDNELLKELAQAVNMYTQMDKIAHQ
ncbi:MAG: hypothetical protein JXA66_08330 [Oligoflexia bacterium]|nr:hypothetical protein [Oligoflexia bacterium]